MEKQLIRAEELLARTTIYSHLAAGFAYPAEGYLKELQSGEVVAGLKKAASFFSEEKELAAAVDNFCKAVEKEMPSLTLGDLEGEYNRIFSMGLICPHNETEYNSSHVFMKGTDMADIAGFYNAFGFEMSDKEKALADFIGTELEFMHVVTFKEHHALEKGEEEHAEICREAEGKFLKGHLGTWVNAFSKVLSATTHLEYFRMLGKLLDEFVAFDGRHLGVAPFNVVSAPAFNPNPEPDAFTCGEPSKEDFTFSRGGPEN
ncbi:MAG: molecular chaperone TorD family protein [Candidatus Brocadiales bacterium]